MVTNFKKFFFVLLFALLCVSIIGCEDEKPSLKLDENSIELKVGESYTIIPGIVHFESPEPDPISYSVSDPEVLEISGNKITAIKAGNASVVLELKGYSDVTATLNVKVVDNKKVIVEGDKEVEVGKTITLTANLENVEGDVVWSSSDNEVATVENGVVTGVKAGTVTIKATVSDLVGELEITVKEATKGLVINGPDKVNEGSQITLEAVLTGSTDAVVWSSSDNEVATVENGVVTGVKAGTVTIKATAGDLSAEVEVEVLGKPAINISGVNEVAISESITLKAELVNLTGDVEWLSNDESIATVENGVVTGVKAGKVTITAKVGEVSNTFEVTVKSNGSIKIVGKTTIYTTKSTTLKTTLTNVEGEIEWSSSDESIATVVDGKVTGVKAGTVVITAKIGDVISTHEMVIEEYPRIEITGSTEVIVGSTTQLTAILINAEGTITWSSKNEKVATVDQNGLVSAIALGKVVIKAETEDLSESFIIDVVNQTFSVIFYGYNGVILSEQEVENGKNAFAPDAPAIENHEFKGWDKDYNNVTSDLEITAIYEKSSYKVSYNFAGGLAEELYLKNGSAVSSLVVNNYNYNEGAFWSNANYEKYIFIGLSSSDPGATFSDRIYIGKDENTGLYKIINILTSGPSSWPAGAEYVITISSSYSAYRANHTKVQALEVGDTVVFEKAIPTISASNPVSVHFYREKPSNSVLSVNFNKATDKLVVPVQLGCEFLGWYDADGKKYESNDDITDDVVLLAKWNTLNPVTDLNVTNMVSELVTGQTYQINASVVPSDAYFTQILYSSSDSDIIDISDSGFMVAGNAGTVTITISDFMGLIVKTYEVTVNMISSIDVNFSEGYRGVLNVGDKVTVIPQTVGKDAKDVKYTFKSSNDAIATVDANGQVTATGYGTVNITVSDNIDSSEDLTIAIVVNKLTEEDKVDKVLKLLAENNFATVETGNFCIYNDGTDRYYQDNYGSVNRFSFADYVVNTEYVAQAEAYTGGHRSRRFSNGFDDSIEFVTVHDTATLTGTVVSIAKNMSQSGTSIHYTTGNDAIYQVVPEKYIAYHAGDGTGTPFKWVATGVKAEGVDPMDYSTYPTFDITGSGSTYYWVINGTKSNIVAPITDGSKTISNPSKINTTDLGPSWKVVDGEFYIGNTWVCFSQFAAGAISSRGGNNNSIGIEMCVNVSSDMYDTLQRTAQLVADILIRNNLDLSRVKMHNTWSGKNCPQVL
ncbi:MAG: Ig-like domain-containing protein, partial [Bacilli bacterium]|nr:Ig-like domain-containing protein [Bacilli bacterium]